MGDATAGKTTSALRVGLGDGFYVSGDRTGVFADSNGVFGVGAAQSTRLRTSSIKVLGLHEDEVEASVTRAHESSWESSDRKKILTHGQLQSLGVRCAHGGAIDAIVVLVRQRGGEPSLHIPSVAEKEAIFEKNVRASRYWGHLDDHHFGARSELMSRLSEVPMRVVSWEPERHRLEMSRLLDMS